MPQVILKGLPLQRTQELSPEISRELATIVNVPPEWIVVEHNDAQFYRQGVQDKGLCMVMIQWATRPRELQRAVAEKLSQIILGQGCDTVEVLYTNLDMEEFYEFKTPSP